MTGTTTTGFKFDVDEKVLDDYIILKLLASVSKGESGKIVDVIERLLGADQEQKLMDHVAKQNDGKVCASGMINEVKEVFEALKAKNS